MPAKKDKKQKISLKKWEEENKIRNLGNDKMLEVDVKKQNQLLQVAPWTKDPHYFKKVKVSAIALMKMMNHASNNIKKEVSGLLQGYIESQTFIVTDAFALPVENVETRPNADQEQIEYMTQYAYLAHLSGKKEMIVGWYLSHPGYGTWLSSCNVESQRNNQKFQDPFICIVVDPVRTVSFGKVDVSAFRTYPEGYKPPEDTEFENISVPLRKQEDYQKTRKQYYRCELEFFKTNTDATLLNLLWNKYWINTLSTSPLLQRAEHINNQISDLSDKMDKVESELGRHASFGFYHMEGKKSGKEESQLAKLNSDSVALTQSVLHGVITQVTKDALFNRV